MFHERATATTLAALSRRVTVGSEAVALLPITVSESGYLVVPHTNKFGHDYSDPDDRGVYPATRK